MRNARAAAGGPRLFFTDTSSRRPSCSGSSPTASTTRACATNAMLPWARSSSLRWAAFVKCRMARRATSKRSARAASGDRRPRISASLLRVLGAQVGRHRVENHEGRVGTLGQDPGELRQMSLESERELGAIDADGTQDMDACRLTALMIQARAQGIGDAVLARQDDDCTGDRCGAVRPGMAAGHPSAAVDDKVGLAGSGLADDKSELAARQPAGAKANPPPRARRRRVV